MDRSKKGEKREEGGGGRRVGFTGRYGSLMACPGNLFLSSQSFSPGNEHFKFYLWWLRRFQVLQLKPAEA